MSKSYYLSVSENQKSFSHIRLNKIKKSLKKCQYIIIYQK